MSKLALAVLCCTTCIAVSARAQDSKPESPLTANPVYQKNCAKCHGKTAGGHLMGGPSLVTPKAAAMPADDLRNIIANGKHHMPKFAGKLQPLEIDALVAQIRNQNKPQ